MSLILFFVSFLENDIHISQAFSISRTRCIFVDIFVLLILSIFFIHDEFLMMYARSLFMSLNMSFYYFKYVFLCLFMSLNMSLYYTLHFTSLFNFSDTMNFCWFMQYAFIFSFWVIPIERYVHNQGRNWHSKSRGNGDI